MFNFKRIVSEIWKTYIWKSGAKTLKEKTDSNTTNEIQHEDEDIEHLNAVKEIQPRCSALKCVEETILHKNYDSLSASEMQETPGCSACSARSSTRRISAQNISNFNQNHGENIVPCGKPKALKKIDLRGFQTRKGTNFTATLNTNTDRILSKQQQKLPVCIRDACMAFFKFVGATSWNTITVTTKSVLLN
uniref:Uncharacterized protein n=1 Tax=Glossina pallidipes TaxID=7398 RepID=A0A1A9ZGN6_GLOPL